MKKLILLVLVSLVVFFALPTLADEYKTIGGTHLSLIPAKTFVESRNYPGYQSAEYFISLTVIDEFPLTTPGEGTSFIEKNITTDVFKQQNITLKSTQKNFLKGVNSILFKCVFSVNDLEYTQWVYYLEGPGFMGQIHVTGPTENFKTQENSIFAMLKSLKWDTKLNPASMYYTISLPKGWSMAKRQALTELYTATGQMMQTMDDPYVMINKTNLAFAKKDRKTVVEGFINSASSTKPKIIKNKEVTIDGQEAYIVQLSINEPQLGKDVIYQSCYIFTDDAAISIVANETKVLTAAVFEQIVKSFKFIK